MAVTLPLRRTLAAAALLAAAPALASCGFNYPTDQVYTPAVGENDRAGSVDVLNALVVLDGEGSGTLVAGIANNKQQVPDALTQVTGAGESQALTASLPAPVSVPKAGFVQLADSGGVPVQGEELKPGAFVRVTFTFTKGEPITLNVPVVEREGQFATLTPAPSESASASSSPSESASESASGSASAEPSGTSSPSAEASSSTASNG